MQKYTILILSSFCILSSCQNSNQKQTPVKIDSIENIELKQVEQLLLNEDSILKRKEKELMKKYNP